MSGPRSSELNDANNIDRFGRWPTAAAFAYASAIASSPTVPEALSSPRDRSCRCECVRQETRRQGRPVVPRRRLEALGTWMILDVGHVEHRRRPTRLCSERLLEWIRELGHDDPVERTRAVVLTRLVLEHQQHFPSYITAEVVVAERAGDDAEMCEHEIACRGGRRTVTVRIEAGGAVVPRRLTIARDGEIVAAGA